MTFKNQLRKTPGNYRVEMAVRAVESNYSASDLGADDFDPSPIALGLDGAEKSEMDANGRRAPAVDACIICGSPLCEDCA